MRWRTRQVPLQNAQVILRVAVSVLTLAPPPIAAFAYQIVDLGDLGGDFARARAINDSGVIVGESLMPVPGSVEHGFLWDGGNMVDLGTLGGSKSRALDIADSGIVAGWAQDAFGQTLPTVWNLAGIPSPLPTLGTNGGAAWAASILDTLAGYSFLTPSTYHAALWDATGVTDLGTLGGNFSVAYDLNASGLVVGSADNASGDQRAALWTPEGTTDLGFLAGGDWNTARGINDLGQVILWGIPTGQSKNRATFWSGGISDAPVDLGTFGGDESWAYGINNLGDVVGWAELAAGNYHAFVWNGSEKFDLGTLGGFFSSAYGINDSGIVVGYAQDVAGQTHAVAWFPIPEPSGQAVLAVLAALAANRWWRKRTLDIRSRISG